MPSFVPHPLLPLFRSEGSLPEMLAASMAAVGNKHIVGNAMTHWALLPKALRWVGRAEGVGVLRVAGAGSRGRRLASLGTPLCLRVCAVYLGVFSWCTSQRKYSHI